MLRVERLAQGRHADAEQDAEKAIELNKRFTKVRPDLSFLLIWFKQGYLRRGAAREAQGKMEEALKDKGMKVRREGRVMRIGHTGDETYNSILQTAVEVGTQVRRMHDHEASLEDLFLVIMERLGHDVKSSEDLMRGT